MVVTVYKSCVAQKELTTLEPESNGKGKGLKEPFARLSCESLQMERLRERDRETMKGWGSYGSFLTITNETNSPK